LAAQQALELEQKETNTRSTCPGMPENAPALGPARWRRAMPDPVPTPTLAPIKPTKALTVHPCSLLAPPKCKIAGVHSAHDVPAAARALTTVDRPLQPTPIQSNPRLASLELREAPRALRPSTTSPTVPD
jgi:hypothetical protein